MAKYFTLLGKMYTESVEDYLKTLYKIQDQADTVTTDALATALRVKQSSATNMLKKLADMGLIHYQPYQGAILTEAGRKEALRVLRHHRLVELFLVEIMGLSWDEVHDEAEKWEHVLSPKLISRIDVMLDYPTVNPHGAPIPNPDGAISQQDCILLSDLRPGQSATVTEVSDDNPELLRYYGTMGLRPGVLVTLVKIGPLGDLITIALGNKEHNLGRQASENVQVSIQNSKSHL